jgi:hypothetical protein
MIEDTDQIPKSILELSFNQDSLCFCPVPVGIPGVASPSLVLKGKVGKCFYKD